MKKNETDRTPFHIIPSTAQKILDVGCGGGLLGEYLRQRQECELYGIEKDPEKAALAQKFFNRVIMNDAETMEFPFHEHYFDCIAFFDVLEHLVNPWDFLTRIAKYLKDDGVIVASIPNIRYFETFASLLNGNWNYQNSGLFDKGHLRFFTRKTIIELFENSGYSIVEIKPSVKKAEIRRFLSFLLLGFLADFFSLHYLVIAEKRLK
ncbi:MAG: class I SAM-dependent methyltransferase [bacterium]